MLDTMMIHLPDSLVDALMGADPDTPVGETLADWMEREAERIELLAELRQRVLDRGAEDWTPSEDLLDDLAKIGTDLLDPTMTSAKVAERTGLSYDRVRTIVETVGIARWNGALGARYSEKVRQWAIDRYLENEMTLEQIAEGVYERSGRKPSISVIVKWVRRKGLTDRRYAPPRSAQAVA